MNKKIIILIFFIIIVIGAYNIKNPQTTTNGKTNTEITVLTQSKLKNGDIIEFQLKDLTGKALSNQNINITYKENSVNYKNYSIQTDNEGKGYLVINGESEGEHGITLKYMGNDKYNSCTTDHIITIDIDIPTSSDTVKTPINSTEML